MQKFQRVISKLANEYLALDAVPEHVIFETQRMERHPRSAHAPIRSLTEAVQVGVRMTDFPEILAKV
jgi:hypothetical protein